MHGIEAWSAAGGWIIFAHIACMHGLYYHNYLDVVKINQMKTQPGFFHDCCNGRNELPGMCVLYVRYVYIQPAQPCSYHNKKAAATKPKTPNAITLFKSTSTTLPALFPPCTTVPVAAAVVVTLTLLVPVLVPIPIPVVATATPSSSKSPPPSALLLANANPVGCANPPPVVKAPLPPTAAPHATRALYPRLNCLIQ